MKKVNCLQSRTGFTLVEMLVVIVIIGLIAGITIPAVMIALTRARQGAHKLEIDSLADAVEKYRNKYGDYPPDGSSWPVMERHLRKAFPQILQSELNLLDPSTPAARSSQGWQNTVLHSWTPASVKISAGVRNDVDQAVISPAYAAASFKVMDPAEALVFFLGGFSSNPQQPFTGAGGPFVETEKQLPLPLNYNEQNWQYNVARSNAFFEFPVSRLTLKTQSIPSQLYPSTMISAYVSTDEVEYQGIFPDLLPVFMATSAGINRSAPIVYFDSRTFWTQKSDTAASTVFYRNYYQCAPIAQNSIVDGRNLGSIRPMISDTPRLPAVSPGNLRPASLLFMSEKNFQIISPGIDGSFGGLLLADFGNASTDLAPLTPVIINNLSWKFPSGDSFDLTPPAVGIHSLKHWSISTPVPSGATNKVLANTVRYISGYVKDNCANFSAATFEQGQP